MKKKIISKGLVFGIIFLFVGAGIIPSTVGTIKEKTVLLNLGSRGYIQGLIDNASDGDTIYVPSGIYYECIVINKSISLVGENKNTTIIDGGGVGNVVSIVSGWVSISGFTIQNSGWKWDDAGIKSYSNSNTIIGNNINSNNYYGIYLDLSSSNNITNNNINSNNWYGIYLSGSNNNITGNNITNNSYGVYIDHSSNNIINCNYVDSNSGLGIGISHAFGNIVTENIISNSESGLNLEAHGWGCSGNLISKNSFINTGICIFWDCFDKNNTIVNNTVNGKPLIYLEKKSDLVIDDAGQIILVLCDNITIQNQKITNTTIGIKLFNSKECLIYHNNISQNILGLSLLWDSCNNNIINNSITNNNNYGLDISLGNNNTISDNDISNNGGVGIGLSLSSNTVMRNNTIQNNIYNFEVGGSKISDYYQDIDTTNTINGKPIYYLVEQSNLVLDDSMSIGHLCLVSCKNISVKNLIFTNERDGLLLVNTSYSIIKNFTLYNNGQYGMKLFYSLNNNITNCHIHNNDDCGIHLYTSSSNSITGNNINSNNGNGIYFYESNDNTISGNNINSNNGNGIDLRYSSGNNNITGNNIINNGNGIYFYKSNDNTISGNNINSNNRNGIYLDESNGKSITCNNINSNNEDGIYLYWSSGNNNITGNNINSNNRYGIKLYGSSNNITENNISNNDDGIYLSGSSNNITENNISNNKGIGLNLTRYSSSNIIYHNNLINNVQNANDCGSESNIWYNAGLQEGNYWSDYIGDDLNGDGIGDKPYDIPGEKTHDFYPFIEPNGWLKEPNFLKAFIFGKITNLSSVKSYITFQAVKTRVITFKPFSFHKYISGENCVLLKTYKGLIDVRYVFALCEIEIRT